MDINDISMLGKVKLNEDGDGYEVEFTLEDGWHVVFCDSHDDGVTMKIRNVILPRIGQRVTVGNGPERRVVKVNRREYDSNGHIFVVDDIGDKYRWA